MVRLGLGLDRARIATVAGARQAVTPISSPRALPDFLIVGAQKSGTTSLYNYLTRFPDVRRALTKEVHYFDHEHDRGERWYRSQFPARRVDQSWVTGEATPYYLLHPHAPQRVAQLVPDARIIVLLRHPVDRAHSHYTHSRALGMEPLADFAQAVDAEQDRTDDAWQALESTGQRQPAVEWYSYLRRGFYAEQLKRWRELFSPESMLVLIAEELFADPAEAVRRARAHLGLGERPSPGRLVAHHTRSYDGMSDQLRRRIGGSLAADVAEVEDIIGRRTGWAL